MTTQLLPEKFRSPVIAAINGGKEIRKVEEETEMCVQLKNDQSPVTKADTQSQHAITEVLKTTGLPILSEEGSHAPYEQRRHWQTFWLVDPLDGTKEFVKGNGQYAVNIALIENDEAAWGLIFIPKEGCVYFGGANWGLAEMRLPEHWQQLPPEIAIETSSIAKKDTISAPEIFTLVASRSHFTPQNQLFDALAKKCFGQSQTVNVGSAIKQVWVAIGKAHCYPRFGTTMEWDTAAGHALLRAVSGEIYNIRTFNPLTYNKPDLQNPDFVCTNAHPDSIKYIDALREAAKHPF